MKLKPEYDRIVKLIVFKFIIKKTLPKAVIEELK